MQQSDDFSAVGALARERLPRAYGDQLGGGFPAFSSVLFPPAISNSGDGSVEAPPYFVDLNLDQVVDALVAKRDERVLRPIFYATSRSEEIVRYRQAIFSDLEHPETFALFLPYCDALQAVRTNLAYADKISQPAHRNTVILRAAALYCEAVRSLLTGLRAAPIQSPGLHGLQRYLTAYMTSPRFVHLADETQQLRETLLTISYGMLFQDDKVTVRRYAAEPDYTVTIQDRFARFRDAAAAPAAPPKVRDEFSLNHIEAGILGFVERLFPSEFRALGDFVDRQSDFVDEVVARCDREIGFYLAYLAFVEPLKRAGLPFCHPDISATDKETQVLEGFDLALAAKLVREGQLVVCNDFALHGAEQMIVVTGPNQGGKTTFARMFGQLHVLAGLGCPVPGRQARLFLADQVFTHFERSENITNLRGKLEDELVRLHQSWQAMSPSSLVILNEIFNSTSLEDQVFLGTKVLGRILATGAIGVCVTFIDGLSTLGPQTVSMVSSVVPGDSAVRTFQIVRRPADGLAYARSLAEKRGVTHAQLCARVRP